MTATATTTTEIAHCNRHGAYEARITPAIDIIGTMFGPFRSHCPTCREERERAKLEREAQEHAQRRAALIAKAGIPPRFRDAALPITGQVREALDAYFERLGGDPGAGLVLIGPPGTGKTYTCTALALHLLGQGHGVAYATPESIARELRRTFRRDSGQCEQDVLDHYGSIGMLILDEIGTTPAEHERTVAHQLIALRYEEQLPSVLVSNLPRPELEAYLGARAADRLAETSAFVPMTGPSRRRRAA